jgi:tetraprenyl-beta-curcumene synthase
LRSWPSPATSRFAYARRWSRPPNPSQPGIPLIQATGALLRATARELSWGLAGVSREVAHWRALASRIPDEALRLDALEALDRKRANIDGAALFTTLPRTRSPDLLRLLVAFEILADYLDCTSERGAHVGIHNGQRLHLALVEALNPRLRLSDYYRYHPWRDDGGYLCALVTTCRATCERLPSYHAVQPLVTRAANLAQVLALNHEENPSRRVAVLRAWASANFPGRDELAWYEWTGAASAWLTILALLALAADPDRAPAEAQATYAAYLPWVSLVGTMLDSYGDAREDAANAAHSYIGHYASTNDGAQRLGWLIRRAIQEAASLPDAPRHLVIVTCMVAMYLSKDTVNTNDTRARTTSLIHTAGPLARLLLPVLRAWRILYGQQTA